VYGSNGDSMINLKAPWPILLKEDYINVILPTYATLFPEIKMQS
jgi:hypothetical protein